MSKTDKKTILLPKESESQYIGQLAKRAFEANCPERWRLKNLDGDDDAGYDYFIQAVEQIKNDSQEGYYKDIFLCQLKGKKEIEFIENGKTVSISLKVRTLRYYLRNAFPIMLAVVDLSSSEKAKNAIIYYKFINEDIYALEDEGKLEGSIQNEITIHIDVNNILNDELDIISEIRKINDRFKLNKEINDLFNQFQSAEKTAFLELLDTALKNDTSQSIFLDLNIESDSPWPSPTPGTDSEYLSNAHYALNRFDEEEAKVHLEKIKNFDDLDNHEKAEYLYLQSRIYEIKGDDLTSLDLKQQSITYHNDLKYRKNYFNAKLRLAVLEGDKSQKVYELLEELNAEESCSDINYIKASALSFIGEVDKAEKIIENNQSIDADTVRVCTFFEKKEWGNSLEIAERWIDHPDIPPNKNRLIHVFKSISIFHLLTNDKDFDDQKKEISYYGNSCIRKELLHDAWSVVEKTFVLLRDAGWPPIIEEFIGIFTFTAIASGNVKSNKYMTDLAELSELRPEYAAVQKSIEEIAAITGDFELAFEANKKQKESLDQISRSIVHKYENGEKREVIRIFNEKLKSHLDEDSKFLPSALAVTGLVADELIEPEIKNIIETALNNNKNWKEENIVYKYMIQRTNNVLDSKKANKYLVTNFSSDEETPLIDAHIITNLDSTSLEESDYIIAAATKIEQYRKLSPGEAIQLSQAYATKSEWKLLLDVANDGIERFVNNNRFKAIKAMACEELGDVSTAIIILEEIISEKECDILAINAYINIALRCGLIETAIKNIKILLEKKLSVEQKYELHILLFNLLSRKDNSDQNIVEIIKRLSELSDPSNEKQEGVFLQLYLLGTTNPKLNIEKEFIENINKRIEAFVKTYPESEIFFAVKYDESNPNEFINQIKKISGITDADRRRMEKVQNQLKHNQLILPYSWLPRKVFINISDIPTLWEVSKNAKKGFPQYYLRMCEKGYKVCDISNKINHYPIIDLISLLLLTDLELLQDAIDTFEKIVITKSTLVSIQYLCHPVVGSVYRETILKTSQIIADNIQDVIQPSSNFSNKFNNNDVNSEKDLISILSNENYSLYSDDAVFRLYVDEALDKDIEKLCTYDLICYLSKKEKMSLQEKAICVAKLSRWNVVGVPIEFETLAANIPVDVISCNEVNKVNSYLEGSEYFQSLILDLWDIDRNLEFMYDHISRLINYLLLVPLNEYAIAAIWGIWILKVEFRQDNIYNFKVLLARSAVIIMSRLTVENDKYEIVRKSYFKVLVERMGDRMDEDVELTATKQLGISCADILKENNLSENLTINRLLNSFDKYTKNNKEYKLIEESFLQRKKYLDKN